MEREILLEAKLRIKQSSYHGIVRQISEVTGLTTRTVRNHLRTDYPETNSTNEIVRVALDLIQNRKRLQELNLANVQARRKKAKEGRV